MTEVLTRAQTSPQPLLADSSTALSVSSWKDPTMLYGPKFSICISLAKTSWDISMETFPSLQKLIPCSGNGKPKTPLSRDGWSIWWTLPWLPTLFASQLQNRFGILLLQPILMGQIRLKFRISDVVLLAWSRLADPLKNTTTIFKGCGEKSIFVILTQWSVLLTYRNTTRFYRKIGFILS